MKVEKYAVCEWCTIIRRLPAKKASWPQKNTSKLNKEHKQAYKNLKKKLFHKNVSLADTIITIPFLIFTSIIQANLGDVSPNYVVEQCKH